MAAVPMQGAMREDALEVAVARAGRVYLGRRQVDLDRLPVAIREGVSHGAERKVQIRADARARYGVVTRVLDSVRSAGVEKIVFLVDARKTLVVQAP
jgi:biopolymer transport protein ExbD